MENPKFKSVKFCLKYQLVLHPVECRDRCAHTHTHTHTHRYIYIYKLVENYGRRPEVFIFNSYYTEEWRALLFHWIAPVLLDLIMLSYPFLAFGITRPGIEPTSSRTLVSRLSNVIHITVPAVNVFHNAFIFSFYPRPISLCWPESLDIFLFLSSWRSSEGSFLVSWIPLDNCTDLFVLCEDCDVYRGTFLSAWLFNYLTSDILIQRYYLHGSFPHPLCCNQALFFLLPFLSSPRFLGI